VCLEPKNKILRLIKSDLAAGINHESSTRESWKNKCPGILPKGNGTEMGSGLHNPDYWLAEGMTGMLENIFLNVKNRSKTITAEIEVPQGGAHGTVIAQGGRFGGWSLYMKKGVPAYDYNFLGLQRTSIAATKPLAPGKATLRFEFAYDGGGLGQGGKGTLFVNGEQAAEGRILQTQAGMFSADETADVGIDLGTPVVEAIGSEAKSRFTGKIPRVTIEVKEMK
jgi:arylsulfatase